MTSHGEAFTVKVMPLSAIVCSEACHLCDAECLLVTCSDMPASANPAAMSCG